MIQRRTLLKTGAAAALGAPAVSGLAQQAVTLKFHTFMAPSSNVWLNMHKAWMDKVEKESGGRIKFEATPPCSWAARPCSCTTRPRDGVVDVVWTLPGNTAGRFPRIEVFELPFMMSNAEATSKAYWEYVQTVAPDEFKDTQVLALQVHGPGVIHTVDKPVKSIADMRGLKLRAPTRQVTKLMGVLGATPVGMPLPQIPDALSKGTITGCVIPWEVVPSVKVHELTKFHAEFDPAGGALHHHLRDGDEQGQVQLAGARPQEGHRQQLRHGHLGLAGQGAAGQRRPGRKTASDRGNTIYTVSAAEAQEFRRKLAHGGSRMGGRHEQARLRRQEAAGHGAQPDRKAHQDDQGLTGTKAALGCDILETGPGPVFLSAPEPRPLAQ
jgi:TRAP-type C4-dicarboxylate transport system substrate-binding protein